MNNRKFGVVAFVGVALMGPALAASGVQRSAVEVIRHYAPVDGTVHLTFDVSALAGLGVAVGQEELIGGVRAAQSDLRIGLKNHQLDRMSGTLSTAGDLTVQVARPGEVQNSSLGDFSIGLSGRSARVTDGRDIQRDAFEVPAGALSVTFDPVNQTALLRGEMVIASSFAHEVLANPQAAGRPAGQLEIALRMRIADVDIPIDPGQNPPGQPRTGADVIVGDLTGPASYGQGTNERGQLRNAYSIGTTSCNRGDVPLRWIASTPEHPVIPQAIYRFKVVNGAGRFEQLGQSWLKHGFCALQQNLCFACQPYGSCCCDHLGVGCSDPYTATRNGSASLLGPKSQVNAATGVFPYPHPTPGGPSSTLRGRIQVDPNDLDPAQNPGAVYYGEAMYVASDDAAAGNDDNNASYRRATFGPGPTYTMSWSGSTVRMQAAIRAWANHESGVNYADIDIPGDGRMTLAWKVTDLGGGRWNYEYALFNMNSDRSGQSFSVPCNGTTVSSTAFHDVDYHSGDGVVIGTNYDDTDWAVSRTGDIRWATQTYQQNTNANALRWSTLYNFRFVASTPPTSGNITIGLFKPGTPSSVSVAAQIPSAPCLAGDLNGDRTVDQSDLGALLAAYGSSGAGDLDCDGDTDQADLGALLSNYGRTCP